jgi:hypothetical protein
MSLSNMELCTAARGCQPRQSRSVTTALAGSPAGAKAPLLAQIPDLDRRPSAREDETAALSGKFQGLRKKLVLAGAVVFVAAAILPFTPLKEKFFARPAADDLPAFPDKPTPAVANAPGWPDMVQNAAGGGAPSTNLAAGRTSAPGAPAYLTPESPWTSNRPAAPSEPGWPPAAATGPGVAPADDRPDRPADFRPGDPAAGRSNDMAAPRKDYQADLRSDPAAAFRGDPLGNPRTWRNDTGSESGHPGVPALPANTLSPAPPAASPDVPATADQAPLAEPGVARLDGTIASPHSEAPR